MVHRDSGEGVSELMGPKGACIPPVEGDGYGMKKPQLHSPERSEGGLHSLPSRKERGWLAPNTQATAAAICALWDWPSITHLALLWVGAAGDCHPFSSFLGNYSSKLIHGNSPPIGHSILTPRNIHPRLDCAVFGSQSGLGNFQDPNLQSREVLGKEPEPGAHPRHSYHTQVETALTACCRGFVDL